MRWKFISLVVAILLVITILVFYLWPKTNGFEIDSIFLKTSIKSNGNVEIPITITNLNSEKDFKISFIDLENFVSSNSYEFSLSKNENKKIILTISNKKNIQEGVYTGSMIVSSNGYEKRIPIIIEIESQNVYFDSNLALYPNNKISPGDRINSEIRIFDIQKTGTSSIDMTYFIKDFNGKTLISEKETIVVSDQTSISKSFDLSSNMPVGDYVYGVDLKFENTTGTSTYFFRVEEEKTNIFSFIMYFLLALIFILLVVYFSFYARDKFLESLRRDYESAKKEREGIIYEKEKQTEKKLNPEERVYSKKIFEKIREKNIEQLNAIQKTREKKLKELKKNNKNNEIYKQIKKWKKQGYDTSLFDVPNANDIKNQIKKWKKQGYNTSLLEEDIK